MHDIYIILVYIILKGGTYEKDKKITVIIMLIGAVCISLPQAQQKHGQVVGDGKPVEFPDAKPFIDSKEGLYTGQVRGGKLGAEVGGTKSKERTIKNVKVK